MRHTVRPAWSGRSGGGAPTLEPWVGAAPAAIVALAEGTAVAAVVPAGVADVGTGVVALVADAVGVVAASAVGVAAGAACFAALWQVKHAVFGIW